MAEFAQRTVFSVAVRMMHPPANMRFNWVCARERFLTDQRRDVHSSSTRLLRQSLGCPDAAKDLCVRPGQA